MLNIGVYVNLALHICQHRNVKLIAISVEFYKIEIIMFEMIKKFCYLFICHALVTIPSIITRSYTVLVFLRSKLDNISYLVKDYEYANQMSEGPASLLALHC
jgi:hypothetical protein